MVLAANPAGSAFTVRLAGVLPWAGSMLSQLLPDVVVAVAVKLGAAAGPVTEIVRTAGVEPCAALSEIEAGETVRPPGLTTSVTATCGVFDAVGELTDIWHE